MTTLAELVEAHLGRIKVITVVLPVRLGFVSISRCSLLISVSLFNNAENTNISDSQINIHVPEHTGLYKHYF